MTRAQLVEVGVAVLAASLAPAVVFAALGGSLSLLTIAFFVALAHAVTLGLPFYLLLRLKNWINGISTPLAGFIIGAIPVGVVTWPLRFPELRTNASVGGVQTMIDGMPTAAGWLQYLQGLLFFGAFGFVGGLAFWATLRSTAGTVSRASTSAQGVLPAPWLRRSARNALLIGVPMLALLAATIPAITKDRSCHNLLRDGRASIGPVAVLDLQIDDYEWPALTDIVRRLATEHHLSLRDNSKVTPDVVRMLYLSACSDDGINIEISEQRWASNNYKNLSGDRGVSIVLYTQRDGSDWPRLANPLVERLEGRWSDKLRFRGPQGQIVSRPPELTAPK
jgi:hypothetical protein